jgi:hypothetical protein
MDRTEYFNHTRPTEIQLNHTEDSRVEAILTRFRSSSQFGVVSGFEISVNAITGTLIDIAVGSGYTGGTYLSDSYESNNSGELIITTDAAYTAQGVALADYTVGRVNYVSLVYSETGSYPLAERTWPFTAHNTVMTRTFTVSVLTDTAWAALSAAELNNRILLGTVTARGAGVNLISTDISQFVQPKTHPYSTGLSTITGVTINKISQDTRIGTGVVRYSFTLNQLYWQAPNDTEGAGVTVPSSGVYTLYSTDTSYWMEVTVTSAALPIVNVSENVYIRSLYGRSVPIFSATDTAHRDMIGSGQVTTTNPHGMTLTDIPGGNLDLADLFHLNAISGDAATDQLLCQIDLVNDRVQITNYGTYANSFLIDGNIIPVLNGVPAGNPAYVQFSPITEASADYMIYVDNNGNQLAVRIATYTPAAPGDYNVLFSANIRIYDIHNSTQGNGTLTWDDTARTLKWRSPADALIGFGTPQYVIEEDWGTGNHSGYYKLYSNNGTDWILVRVLGAIGGAGTSTFDIRKDEASYADESILKLAVVTWNQTDEVLVNIRDIRRFVSSDIRPHVEYEHDAEGLHTKVLRQELRIGVESQGLHAMAQDQQAIFGEVVTGNTAVYGSAGSLLGVQGVASASGIYGYATGTGVMGSALNTAGVYGKASATGVAGSAVETGVYATAMVNTAIYGVGGRNLAVYGVVTNATNAFAENITGMYGVAEATPAANSQVFGVYGNATNAATAASATGVFGKAVAGTGVVGSGGIVGVFGNCVTALAGTGVATAAETAYGVRVIATNATNQSSAIAVLGSAPGNLATGVFGVAASGTGAYGSGLNRGLHASGGAAAYVSAVWGLVAVADNSINNAASQAIGVYGAATNAANTKYEIGVNGAVVGTYATGVCGNAVGNSATGVLGAGPGVSGTGVAGTASGAGGSGVYAEGNLAGVVASAYGNPGIAGKFVHASAGGTAISATGAYLGAVISAGDNTRAAGIYGISVVALNNTNDGASLAVGLYASAYNYADGIDCVGVSGIAGVGVFGKGVPTGGIGVYGLCSADNGNGVYGTGRSIGVQGYVTTAGATGVYGYHNDSGAAIFGNAPVAGGTGLYGVGSSIGIYGSINVNARGIFGSAPNGTGVCGEGVTGVHGIATNPVGIGVWGWAGGTGVYGTALVSAMYAAGGNSVIGAHAYSNVAQYSAVYGAHITATADHGNARAVGISVWADASNAAYNGWFSKIRGGAGFYGGNTTISVYQGYLNILVYNSADGSYYIGAVPFSNYGAASVLN